MIGGRFLYFFVIASCFRNGCSKFYMEVNTKTRATYAPVVLKLFSLSTLPNGRILWLALNESIKGGVSVRQIGFHPLLEMLH